MHLTSFVRSAGTTYADSEFYLAGSAVAVNSTSSGTNSPSTTQNGVTLAANYFLQQFFHGAINEVVVAETSSATDRQKLEGYLAHKWGTTSSLPANHPYKTSAPTV